MSTGTISIISTFSTRIGTVGTDETRAGLLGGPGKIEDRAPAFDRCSDAAGAGRLGQV